MKYELVDKKTVGDPPTKKIVSKNARAMEALLTELQANKSKSYVKINLEGTESARGMKASATRAAKKMGLNVVSWDADGGKAVYVGIK